MDRRVAVVTGANRGIGLAVCAQLAARGLQVVLTSRDVARGQAARRVLAGQGHVVDYHQLDVCDPASVRVLAAYASRVHGGVDVLINNAGVLLDPKGSRALDLAPETLADTLAVNVQGPVCVCRALVPLMVARHYGRVVNVSSGMGQLAQMGSGSPAYRISKAALNACTRTLAADLMGTCVLVNAMCPGWCRTDMGGTGAERTPEQGADTAVWLATLPEDGPSGGFFRDRQPIAW